MKRPTLARRNRPRRRGTMYLITLCISSLVSVVGIASLKLHEAMGKTAIVERDILQAHLNARSGIEFVLLALENNATWRTDHTNDSWSSARSFDGGEMRYKLIDDSDSNLADNALDEVRIVVEAVVGEARRVWTVSLRPDDTEALHIIRSTFKEDVDA